MIISLSLAVLGFRMQTSDDTSQPWAPPLELWDADNLAPVMDPYYQDPYKPDPYAKM